METEKFELSRHICQVQQWANQWKLPLRPEMLPLTGRIVPGKAVIFLYKTDSTIGFLENLICNREETKQSVSEAINACVEAIQKDALEIGMTHILCHTNLSAVAERAIQTFGYSSSHSILLTKELS